MKFAIMGFDFYISVFETFLSAGWKPVKAFTWPVDGRFDTNTAFEQLARSQKIPIQLSRIQNEDFEDLARRGCDVLICGGYPWKIGDWREHLPHAINFHPSPLPEARGPYPSVRAILEGRSEWAVSCHKIDLNIDTGDILAQTFFPMSQDECQESLFLKTQLNLRKLAHVVSNDFSALWNNAKPQIGGSYWNRWTDDERTLDFSKDVADVMRVVRAFGKIECFAQLNNRRIFIRRAVAWEEAHNHPAGQPVHRHENMLVIAAKNGYVGLIEFSYIDPLLMPQMGR